MHTDTATIGDRYEIVEWLGLKGVSIVYRGYDRADGREVVIKRVAPNFRDRYTEKDLVEDAIALSSLKGPNFLTVYDYGRDENGPFVVAEALQGIILDGTLQKSVLSVEEFISLVKQTLESLIAAHEAGLMGVHLDPWNIMLLRQAGGRYRLKILGLGRSAANALPILETEYSLEQGMRHANPWAEFLSLGRLYYQALTGFRPFGNEESALVQGSPAMEELAPCHGRRPDVPTELCDWVMWLILAADRERGLTAERVLERFLATCANIEEAPTAAGEEAAAAATRRAEAILTSHAMDEAHEVYAEYVENLLKAQSAEAEAESSPKSETVEPATPAVSFAQVRQPAFPPQSLPPRPHVQRQRLPHPLPQALQVSQAQPAPETPNFEAQPKAAAPSSTTDSAPKAKPETVEATGGAKAIDGASAGTTEQSGKSSRRKKRRRAAAKRKKSAARKSASPAETENASGSENPPGPPRSARSGEVPLADGGSVRKIESHGVFLPAPEDVFPDDLKQGIREEPAANPGEAATKPDRGEMPDVIESRSGKTAEANPGPPAGKGDDAEIPDIVLPEFDVSAIGLSNVDSKSAEPGPLEAPEPELEAKSKLVAEFAWPNSWPNAWLAADSLREGADAEEPAPAGTGAGSWRVPMVALAVLLCASIIVLAGSLTKSRSRSNGSENSTTAASVASPTAGTVAEVNEVKLPAVEKGVPASPEGNAGAADAKREELLSEGKAAEARGEDLEAITHYMTAKRSYPDSAEVNAALTAYIESFAGRPPDVIGFLDRALVECAEEHGIRGAMRLLGERAMAVENWGDAYHWLSKAAVEEDVPGTRLLGLLLATGQGAPRDLEAAAECFEWAANKGDLRAGYLAGECYVLGKGVEKDPARGIDLLEGAVAAGDLRAVDLMGFCHAHGLGTEKNYDKALACFREAVEGGYPAALANLGVLYIQGQGVKQDAAAAAEYFREGAEANNATCMFYYAKCFEKGLGVEASRVSAVEWYGRAAAGGNEEARKWFAASRDDIAN